MEIKYTNFLVDDKIYGRDQILGLIDKTGEFIYETFYDVKSVTYNKKYPVILYLRLGAKKELVNTLLEELEISKELYWRKLRTLSSSELLKVNIIKLLTNDSKTIILDSIDGILTPKDLHNVIKTIKSHLKELNKTIIYTSNNTNLVVENVDRIIVAQNNTIIYNDRDFKKAPIDIDTKIFADNANKKGAKLDYYKDINDLLKAVYRDLK